MAERLADLSPRMPCAGVCFSSRNFENRNSGSRNERTRWSLFRKCPVAFVAAGMLASAIGAQGQVTLAPEWNQLSPPIQPAARYVHALTYDAAHSQVVLFGGFTQTSPYYVNDTWLWNGTTWTQANPATSPDPRGAHAMVYDAGRGQVVLFGGFNFSVVRFGDTWLWNGSNWTQANPANSPSARDGAVMVYNAPGNNVLLFGGSTPSGDVADTWSWDGTNWTQVSTSSSPSPRADYSMAYDPATGNVVLFGGSGSGGSYLNDTWIWNGTTWVLQNPVNSPPGRSSQGMAYDPALGEVIMWGGEGSSGFLSDTWAWNGTNWTQLNSATSPAGRYATNTLTYDGTLNQLLLFSGQNSGQAFDDTWAFTTSQNFGSVNVCSSGAPAPCSNSLTLSYSVATTTTFGTPQVVTQGATGLDFSVGSGGTCANQTVSAGTTCTVNVTFTPTAPGLREGAVELFSSANSTTPLVTTLLYGTGEAPLAAFSPLTSYVQSTGSQTLSSPEGVAVDAADDLYIANTGDGNVVKVSANNTASTVGSGLNFPESVAVDGAGDVFIGQFGPSVTEVPVGCTQQSCQISLGSLSAATAVAVDRAGNVFIGDQNLREVVEVLAANPAAQIVIYNPGGSTFEPGGLALDPQDDLYIADYGSKQVWEIRAGDYVPIAIGSGWIHPSGVTLDAAGDLYVADSGLKQVVEVPAGCVSSSCEVVVATASQPSLGSNFSPSGVAVDSQGNISIADLGLNRVDTVLQSLYGLSFSESSVGNVSGDSPESVTLQNIGNQALDALNPGLAFTNPSFYQVPGSGTPADCTTTFSLAAGATCNTSIDFDPLTSGLATSSPFEVFGSAIFEDNSLNNTASFQYFELTGQSLPSGTEYLLSVTAGGGGSGSVLDNMSAISCNESSGSDNGQCSANYASGAPVTLTASPAGGSTFVSWGAGACETAGTNPTCIVTMNSALNVSASFAPGNFGTANVCVEGAGPAPCSSTFPVTFNFASPPSVTSAQVLTDGVISTEFQPNSSVCAGNTCTVSVTFRPQAAGVRRGAVQLLNGSTVIATQLIFGIGKAPETAFGPTVTFTHPLTPTSQIFDSSQVTQPPNLATPLTTDAEGTLYQTNGTTVQKLSPPYSGSPTTVATGFSNPVAGAIDGAGNLYIADSGLSLYGEVLKLAPGCAAVSCASVLYAPTVHPDVVGVAVDGSGNVFIADNPAGILELPVGGGSPITLYNPGGGSAPLSVAVDGAGDVFVADSGLSKVVEIPAGCTTAGCQINIGSGWSSPESVAVDAAGDVIVADLTLTIDGQASAGGVVEVPSGCTTSACQILLLTAGAYDPYAVTISAEGQLFIATDGGSYEIDQSQPPAVNFGSVNVGLNTVQTFTLQNIGNEPLNSEASPIVSVSGTSFFSYTSSGGPIPYCTEAASFSIEPGQSCLVGIIFEATVPGAQVGTATISDNNLNGAPATQTANLSGTGVAPLSYSLAITDIGSGSGEVTSNDALISCSLSGGVQSGNCSYTYPTQTNVTLTAIPVAGSVFVGWSSGGCTGTSPTCTIAVNSAYNVTAAFTQQSFGSVSVCAGGVASGCSGTSLSEIFNFTTSATFSTIRVVTQGATGLDFQLASGGSCAAGTYPANSTCTVNVAFTPLAPGLRLGAVQLLDSSNNVLATQLISGVGQGPATAFTSSTQTILPATGLNRPTAVALDAAGDLFISDYANNQIVKLTPGGVQTTVPTNGLSNPRGVAVDGAGDLFIADDNNNRVVEIPAGCTTSACQVTVPTSGMAINNGTLAVDGAGDIFIADTGHARVVEVTPSGVQTTVPATGLSGPFGVAVDAAGDVFIADTYGSQVVEVTPAGVQTTVPTVGVSAPEGVWVDAAGDVFVADSIPNSRIVEVPAGSGAQFTVYTGSSPEGVVTDGVGDVYIADTFAGHVVEINQSQAPTLTFDPVNVNTRSNDIGVTIQNVGNQTLTGSVASASNSNFADDLINSTCSAGISLAPGSTCVQGIYAQPTVSGPVSGTVAVNDNSLNGNPATQTINLSGSGIAAVTYALTATEAGTGSGTVTSNSSAPAISCAISNGSVTGTCSESDPSGTLVTLTASAGAGSTFVGWGGACASAGTNPQCTVTMTATTNVSAAFSQESFGGVNVCVGGVATGCTGSSLSVTFNIPASTTIGAVQVVTQGATGLDFTLGSGGTCTPAFAAPGLCTVNVNFTPLAPGLRMGAVELYNTSGSLIASTPVYGVGQGPEIAFGPAAQITAPGTGLTQPYGLAVDAAGDLFVGEPGANLVLKITPGGSQTTVGSITGHPYGLAVDGAGDLFIAELNNDRVVEVTPGGVQSTVPATGLTQPIAVAVDGAGDLFISDRNNNRVVELPAGCTSSACQITLPTVGLNQPYGLALDATGDVFIADFNNNRVVKVTPGGVQTTVPTTGLTNPYGVAVDAAGDVFIVSYNNGRVIEVTPGGVQTTVPASGLNGPSGVALDGAGDLFISDYNNNRVVEINQPQPPSHNFSLTNIGATSTDSPYTVSVQNVGNQPLSVSAGVTGTTSFVENPVGSACGTTTPSVLAPGASCNESFAFAPQSTGILNDSASFSDNTMNLSSSVVLQTVNLSGIGSLNGATGTAVPNVVGMTEAAAATTLTDAGLTLGSVGSQYSSSEPAGSVIGESPAAGSQVNLGSAVALMISTGEAPPASANPLTFENNYFVTGDYATGGVTLRTVASVGGMASGTITIPDLTSCNCSQGVPDGADIVDGFLYWTTVENTATPSGNTGTFLGYSITGQQVGTDVPNYNDGTNQGTLRVYRADINTYFQVQPNWNGERLGSGSFAVSLPDINVSGGKLTIPEGASLVVIYRALVAPGSTSATSLPLKSVVIYDGSAVPSASTTQTIQGFYDAVGGAGGTGEVTTLYAASGLWNNAASTPTLGSSSQYNAPLSAGNAYAAVILSTPVNNSDNDGILDAWKAGPAAPDFFAGQPGYYDVKTQSWVSLPGAKHGQKDLFVQLDYMCGAVLANGQCDPSQENLFPSPDSSGNNPLTMVQQAFAQTGITLHLEVGNAVPENTCTDNTSTTPAQLCEFPGEPGVIGWKNILEFSKLWPRNFASCAAGGDCTARFPYGQKDSYHYVLFGHSLAIPAWNSQFGSLSAIAVANGVTTITTANRGTGINECPSRITISGVLSNPTLNGVYNTSSCPDTQTIIVSTPGVPNWKYSYATNTPPEPAIGLTSGTVTSISGYSDLGGADSAVTLALWETAPNQDMSKRAQVIAGTLFHEIGHTLGLAHGGIYFNGGAHSYVPTFDVNCKPNYQSSMNYLFQLGGVGPNAAVAYSNQTLETLSGASLNTVTNLVDINSLAASYSTSDWYAPVAPANSTESAATLHCDGTPLNGDTGYLVQGSVAPVTPAWSAGQNITFDGVPTGSTGLLGYNDVANLDLRQVGATGGEFASLAGVISFGNATAPLNVTAGGNVTMGAGGSVALGAGGSVTLTSGGSATVGSGATISGGGQVTLGTGGSATLSATGTITPGTNGVVTLPNGGNISLSATGTITLPSGGNITLGAGGNVTLGAGGTITLPLGGGTVLIPPTGGVYTVPAGGTITLGAGGNVTLGAGGNITLGAGGNVTLGAGGNVTLGGGGNVTLGAGGNITLGAGGNVTLGAGGNITLGAGGNITLGAGGNVTLGAGGNVTLGAGGNVTLGAGGNVTLGAGGNVTLGAGGNVTLGAGGSLTLPAGGNLTLGAGGNVTLGAGGTITSSNGTVTISAGGTYTIPSGGGNVTLGAGGNITLGGGGTVTLGAGGNVTLGAGGNITLGAGGNVTLGAGGNITLGAGGNITLGAGGATSVEMDYNTANSVVRPPVSPTYTVSGASSVQVSWMAPAFGVVQSYTISRSVNSGPPVVIGTVSGVNGFPPLTTFTDTSAPTGTLVYTIATTLVPDSNGPSRQSAPSPPAVLTLNQTVALGALQSSYAISSSPVTITATAESNNVANGLMVNFSTSGSCTAGASSLTNGVSSTTLTLTDTGSCTVTATVPAGSNAGNNYNAATPASATFSIVLQTSGTTPQVINFLQLPNLQYGRTFILAATDNSGLPITYQASGPCTSSGTTTGIGTCTITASAPAGQTNNTTYSAVSVHQSFTIYPAVLTVTAGNLTSGYGQIPSLVSDYTIMGYVNGDSSSVLNGTLPALSTTATSTSGPAIYPINVSIGSLAAANYSFVLVPGTLTINQATQAINFTTNAPSSASLGSSFNVAATASSGLPVAFTSAGSCTNSGTMYTMTSSTGTCSVIANQAGNSNYGAAPQVIETVTAGGSITVSPSSINFGSVALGSITIKTVTVSNTGTTAFTISTPIISILKAGNADEYVIVSLCPSSLAGGKSCTIAVSFVAGAYYNTPQTATLNVMDNAPGSPQQVALTATVLQPQTISFTTNPPASAAYNSGFTVAATGGGSGNPVTFTSSGSCSNIGAAYTMTRSTSTCLVIANQAGNSNYSAAMQVTKSVTATVAPQTITFTTSPPSTAGYKTSFTVAATASSGLAVSFTSSGSCSNSGATYTMTSSTGTCSVIAKQVGNSNYSAAPQVTKSVTATVAPQTITFTINAPATAAYKTSFTVAATASSGLAVSYTSSGSCTNSSATYTMNSGTGTCSVIASQAGNSNYSAASPVTQKVTATFSSATLSPGSINFGVVASGKSSSAQTATLTNTGTTPLIISNIGFTGTNPSNFTQTSTCPSSSSSLAAGKSCTISVTFKSSGKAASANLVVTDNTQTGTQTVTISGS